MTVDSGPARPCERCRNADPERGPFPPPEWRELNRPASPEFAWWARGVWRCALCGSLWVFKLHPKDMYYYDVALLAPRVDTLLRAGTPFEAAWALRDDLGPAELPFLERYLASTRELPWLEAARRAVAELESSGGEPEKRERRARCLRALYENAQAQILSHVTVAEMAGLRQRVAALSGSDSDLLQEMLQRERQRRTNAALTAGRLGKEAADIQRRAEHPPPRPGRSIIWEKSTPGPARAAALAADRPAAGVLARAAAEKILSNPFAYAGPFFMMLFFVELLPSAPIAQAPAFMRLAFFMTFLSYYSAAAATVSGRWETGGIRLYGTRMVVFRYWLIPVLIFLATAGLYLGSRLVFRGLEPSTARDEALCWAAVPLVLWRLWPNLAVPFVYQGYTYQRWGTPAGSGAAFTWIGPSYGTAWRLSGQDGFGLRVTLPASLVAAVWLALLTVAGWSRPIRVLSYAFALPFLAQFADEAVARWRVKTGNPAFDG